MGRSQLAAQQFNLIGVLISKARATGEHHIE